MLLSSHPRPLLTRSPSTPTLAHDSGSEPTSLGNSVDIGPPDPLPASFGAERCSHWASKEALVAKNLPAKAGDVKTQVQSLGREDALEEGMATHSGILAWRIPGQRSLAGYRPRRHREADVTGAA